MFFYIILGCCLISKSTYKPLTLTILQKNCQLNKMSLRNYRRTTMNALALAVCCLGVVDFLQLFEA